MNLEKKLVLPVEAYNHFIKKGKLTDKGLLFLLESLKEKEAGPGVLTELKYLVLSLFVDK